MKYLQLVCIEGGNNTPEAATTMREAVGPWVEETIARRINVVGKPLDDPASAKTVWVQNGETLVSDGPFTDTKEFIGGLDILECENLDEAIEVEAQLASECKAFRSDLRESGMGVLSQPLAGGQDNATTVRVRNGETLITDGPFIETKEFLAGIDILRCDTFEEAVGWAARHPIARFHRVEVRHFVDL